jgi:protein-S-isoprenylcysteine O-methyltransferase Ste14
MNLKLALVATASVLVQFGLAILGWGGFGPFFSHPPFIALAIICLMALVAGLFTAGNLSAGEREDRSNRWVFIVFGVSALLLAFVPAYTDRKDIWTIDGDGIRWLGVFGVTVGGTLRLWPIFVLGRRFSGLVAIQPEHKLVTDGIYGHIRHPSYLGLLITAFAWALAFRSGLGLLIAAVNIVAVVGRIKAEERLLQTQFGAEYDAYRARTWRLIPWLY